MADVLTQIHAKVGITFKGSVFDDRVSGKFGPGITRDILEELLVTRYGYVIVGDGTPDSVTTVVLVNHDAITNGVYGEPVRGQPQGGTHSAASPKPSIPAARAAADNVEDQQPVKALPVGSDGSPYVGGTGDQTVKQSHDSLRQMEQQRSQQLSQGNGNN
ncbi:MAG TPA: hypothetical protein VMF66_18515 [Candidatus Acidoferrum sp.]|nr:hypothetical protein [Candidatus Acidoferrum sp.]